MIDEKEYGRAEESIDRAIKIEEYRDAGLFLKAVIKYKEGKKEEAEKLLDLMKLKDNIYVKKLKERLK